jgi:hypothetical protein
MYPKCGHMVGTGQMAEQEALRHQASPSGMLLGSVYLVGPAE